MENNLIISSDEETVTIEQKLFTKLVSNLKELDLEQAASDLKEKMEWILDGPTDIYPNIRATLEYKKMVEEAYYELKVEELRIKHVESEYYNSLYKNSLHKSNNH